MIGLLLGSLWYTSQHAKVLGFLFKQILGICSLGTKYNRYSYSLLWPNFLCSAKYLKEDTLDRKKDGTLERKKEKGKNKDKVKEMKQSGKVGQCT